jgi:sec-independent protein translocase protein TatA
MMGDMAKGIKAFKRGMADDDTASTEPAKSEPKTIDHQSASSVRSESEKKVG